MSEIGYWFMNNWIQAMPECGRLPSRRMRLPAASIPMLILLGGLLVWSPMRAGGQVFGINPIPNINVLAGTPITFQISVTNTTGANVPLTWNLNSSPSSTASISPISTGPLDPTTFIWTPSQTQSVLFTVSISQINTTNISATSFSVTVTNSTVSTFPPSLTLPLSSTNITSGMTLTFTAFATNTDSSANTLTFSLDANTVATGATITNITPTNG